MLVSAIPTVVLPIDLPAVSGPSAATHAAGEAAIGVLAHLADASGIDVSTLRAFLSTAGMVKDGAMGMKSAYASVSDFKAWMAGGPAVGGAALTTLAHGLNAVAMLDKAGGNTIGMGLYTNAAGGVVSAAKLISGLQRGDMSEVLFSGARLCATLAAAGSPIAGVTITIAEQAYKQYIGYGVAQS